jgi:hypothetical protein
MRDSMLTGIGMALVIGCGTSNREGEPEAGPGAHEAGSPSAIDAAPEGGSSDAAHADAGASGRCPDFDPLGNLYWGDLHAHTSYSLDSYAAANRNDPKDAYAFARGATVPIGSGQQGSAGVRATIDRPLDFLAVTDHSEFLDVTGECLLGATARANDPYCTAYRDQGSTAQSVLVAQAGLQLTRPDPNEPLLCQGGAPRGADCRAGAKSAWQKEQQAAAAANVPCAFTSIVGYEWTAQTGTANLHRNVLFATSKVPDVPLDYVRYPTALALWTALDAQCKVADGCDAITIPHNANASFGRMWETTNEPAAIAFMERYQVLTEIFQHKGNSECLPGDALSDPACDFEIVPGSFLGSLFGVPLAPNDGGAEGYVRPGLARGLAYAAAHGDNPLELGIVGATDTHNGTPGNVRERGWVGHLGTKDDTPAARIKSNLTFNPGGITGVWAAENTREQIFAALKRRETYATSGPRIVLRFYAAADVADDVEAQALCDDPSFPRALVVRGARPMGGTVRGATAKPYLFVHALKDEASLGAIDVVKLASDPGGKVSLEVRPFPLASASRACVFWRDDEARATDQALYYARVFEEPTPRWSHHDCQTSPPPAACADGGADVSIRERAWSSPVFFKPL